jgi:WD40 repeat protein
MGCSSSLEASPNDPFAKPVRVDRGQPHKKNSVRAAEHIQPQTGRPVSTGNPFSPIIYSIRAAHSGKSTPVLNLDEAVKPRRGSGGTKAANTQPLEDDRQPASIAVNSPLSSIPEEGESARFSLTSTNAAARRKEVLVGGFFPLEESQITTDNKIWRSPKWRLMVFVSSTFTDTQHERNLLLESIQPRLRETGRQHGISVTFVDMRWGIRDESTIDHGTWTECQKSIERCEEDSTGMFFMSLQSDKYGYRSLPKYVTVDDYKSRLAGSPDLEIRELAAKWYILDTNSTPPHYVLHNLNVNSDNGYNWKQDFWTAVLPALRAPLAGVCLDTSLCTDLLVDRSVTEWEAKYAMMRDGNLERCLWLHRSFSGGVTEAADPKQELFDGHDEATKQKLQALKAYMRQRIPSSHVATTDDISVRNFNELDEEWNEYLSAWEALVGNRMQKELDSIIALKTSWELDGDGVNIEGAILEDILHHGAWAYEKCATFVGREDLIQDCLSIICGSRDSGNRYGISLALVASSGMGKTALMAKLAQQLYVREVTSVADAVTTNDEASTPKSPKKVVASPKSGETLPQRNRTSSRSEHTTSRSDASTTDIRAGRPVIIRFCGTNRFSKNGLQLVRSICHQILGAVDLQQGRERSLLGVVPQKYELAVTFLHNLLADNAVILLIDSLDQLSDLNQARSQLSFLKGVRPHPDTRIIVSTLPDDFKEDLRGGKNYFYGCCTKIEEANVRQVVMKSHISSTGECVETVKFHQMMKDVLRNRRRDLTVPQWKLVSSCLDVEATALYVTLAVRIVEPWRSSDDMSQLTLAPTVRGIISQLLDSVEVIYGKNLVRTALALITYSVDGISDNEMEDLLSLDETVLIEVFQYHKPTTRRLPSHVWLRIREGLAGLVAERDRGCIAWYHRQLLEAADVRYADKKVHVHSLMARYFGDLVDTNDRESKKISAQPLLLTNVRVWFGEAVVNTRRCVEAVPHLLESGMLMEAMQEICHLEKICAIVKCGEGFNLVQHAVRLNDLVSASPDYDEKSKHRVHDYMRWLKQCMTAITRDPTHFIMDSCTATQPFTSIVRDDWLSLNQRFKKAGLSSGNLRKGGIFSVVLGGTQHFSSLLCRISGHTDAINSVAFCCDGIRLASGSDDTTVRIWDSNTGALLVSLEGHKESVTAITWSPDGERVASASRDQSVFIWNASTGSLISKLVGHSTAVLDVAWSMDGTRIVSASHDMIVRIWDPSGRSVLKLEGHTSAVNCVACSPDGRLIASGSSDRTVRVWSTLQGNQIRVLAEHYDVVRTISFSPDGSRLISGDVSRVIVWDALSGMQYYVQHSIEPICAVQYNHDGSHIVFGSGGGRLRVRDAVSETLLFVMDSQSGSANSVGWSPDGRRIVSGSADHTIGIWDAINQPEGGFNPTEGHSASVTSVSWSPEGRRLASASTDESVIIWNVVTGRVIASLKRHTGAVHSTSWSPDGLKVVSGSSDSTLRIWDSQKGDCLLTVYHPTGVIVSTVSWSPDGIRILSGSDDGICRIWSASSGKLLGEVSIGNEEVSSASWSPDGTQFATVFIPKFGESDGIVSIWDSLTLAMLLKLKGKAMSWSPTGNKVVIAPQQFNETKTEYIGSLSWSSATDRIARASGGQLVISSATAGSQLVKIDGHAGDMVCVCWSPDGSQIASVTKDNRIRVWNCL